MKIKQKGGLKAIVISHPHYYTTYANWATVFECPVYIAYDDRKWLCQQPHRADDLVLFKDVTREIVPGVTAVKIGKISSQLARIVEVTYAVTLTASP